MVWHSGVEGSDQMWCRLVSVGTLLSLRAKQEMKCFIDVLLKQSKMLGVAIVRGFIEMIVVVMNF